MISVKNGLDTSLRLVLQDFVVGGMKVSLVDFLWFAMAALAALLELSRGTDAIGNFILYKNVFFHALDQTNLYAIYPDQNGDSNHYGPFFSIVIAPFALLPVKTGCFLWCMVNASVLFAAIRFLPAGRTNCSMILLICLVEFMTSIHSVQFNPMLTGWILLSYILVELEWDFLATLFIAAGFLVKLYGIAGIICFLFSQHKGVFTASLFLWLLLFFAAPMLISSPAFVYHAYYDWVDALINKNHLNIRFTTSHQFQDISLPGMIRRIFNYSELKSSYILLLASLAIALPALRVNQYHSILFRLSYVSLTLISVVLFSSSSESPTYIIAVVGVAIWFVGQWISKPTIWKTCILWFVIIVTELMTTDLFPHWIKTHFLIGYSLKALPCFIVWLVIIYQLLFLQFDRNKQIVNA